MQKYFWIVCCVLLQSMNPSWSMYSWLNPYYISKRNFMTSQPRFDVIKVPLCEVQERDHDTPIKAVIVHCVGLPTILDIVQTFQKYRVSSHYLVPQIRGEEVLEMLPDLYQSINQADLALPTLQFPEKVPVIQFLVDNKIAEHAGESYFSNWNQYYTDTDVRVGPITKSSLNACSIGVEFHAPGYANSDGSDWYHFVQYTDAQMETGISLLHHLKENHKIPAAHFLAHSTISPGRKTDPGPLFHWRTLAAQGIGYMPPVPLNDTEPLLHTQENIRTLQKHLERIGFRTDLPNYFGPFNWGEFDEDTKKCLSAYTLQFFPEQWQKPDDIQITPELLRSLENFDEKVIKTTYNGNDS